MTLFAFIIASVKFQLKLFSAYFFIPLISCNELSVTLSTLWLDLGMKDLVEGILILLSKFTYFFLYCIRCEKTSIISVSGVLLKQTLNELIFSVRLITFALLGY